MKKLITGILAILMCGSALVACNFGGNNSSSDSSVGGGDSSIGGGDSSVGGGDSSVGGSSEETALELARDFILGNYIEKNVETRQDYTMPNSIYSFVAEEDFNIVWSVDVTTGVTVVRGESESTIKIDPELAENMAYVLTGTITNSANESITVTFNRTALGAPQYVPVAITSKPAEDTAYKLYFYNDQKPQDCYFVGEMNGFYYKTATTAEEGVDLYVEHIANSEEFHVYFMDKNNVKQYIGIQEGWNSKNLYWTFNAVFDEVPPCSFVYSTDYKAIMATVPCRSEADNKNQQAAQTTTQTVLFGTSGTYVTFDAIKTSKAAESHVGSLYLMTDKNSLGDELKAQQVLDALSVQEKHTLDKQVTLPSTSDTFGNATITWTAEEGKGATIANNVMTLAIPATATQVKLTATVVLGDATLSKDFTITIGPKTEVPADKTDAAAVVAAAFNLAAGETLPGGNYTLTGTVASIKTAYSDQYGNITVLMTVEGRTLEVYRMVSGAANVQTIKAGDEITVTGTIKNYNGTIEFDQGCTLDAIGEGSGSGSGTVTPPVGDADLEAMKAIVEAAYALEKDATLAGGPHTLTGTIISVDSAYSTQYYNVTVTIVVGDLTNMPIQCYRMKGTGADVIGRGDIITVTGTIVDYNGTKEFNSGCTLVSFIDNPEPKDPNASADAKLTFDDASKRTVFNANQQVWVEDGITFTNNKASSSSDVANYTAPVRIYSGSEVIIECDGMTKLVFSYTADKGNTGLVNALTGSNYSVEVDGVNLTVTVTFDEPTDSLTFKASAQVRFLSISVYTN